MKKVFVTVGTTKFQKLVDAMTSKEVIETLSNIGFDFVQIQTGRNFSEVKISPDLTNISISKENESTVVQLDYGMTIKYNEYFEDFEEQIKKADLIISHAGAGSCLDVLRQNKPLLVVINNDLMDNHQTELAKQLENNGHLYFCTCETLTDVLNKDFSTLKPYPKPDIHLFSNNLDRYCGFVD